MPVQPRRTFTPSFVLTVVGSVSVAAAAPPPPTRKPTPSKRPPPKVTAPKTDRHFHYMQMDKKCMAHDLDACRVPAGQPAPPCNPPPPMAVACPENVTLPQKVVQRAGSTECFVDWGPMSCPKDMKCNPPPPRKVACPTPFSPSPD